MEVYTQPWSRDGQDRQEPEVRGCGLRGSEKSQNTELTAEQKKQKRQKVYYVRMKRTTYFGLATLLAALFSQRKLLVGRTRVL